MSVSDAGVDTKAIAPLFAHIVVVVTRSRLDVVVWSLFISLIVEDLWQLSVMMLLMVITFQQCVIILAK